MFKDLIFWYMQVYSSLQSQVGLVNQNADGFSWTLLRCIHDDQKVHSAQWFALKAVCNTKLAVALTIMEECFVSMLDLRTGIHMIPQVLYNWGSDFARLNFQGFYTVVLEKQDVLISVASIRVHGTSVAEMPLIATCSRYRRQGMCRRLVNSIEEMLMSVKVEKLVVSAIPELVETWTKGFGFVPVELCDQSTLETDICSKGMAIAESLLQDAGNVTAIEVGAKSEYEPMDCKNQPDNTADSETNRDDNTQAVEIALGGKESTETSRSFSEGKITPGEGHNVQELRTCNMQIENRCPNKDGTESGVRLIEEKNIEIGEVEENALHGHVSNASCKAFPGNNFEAVSNFDCSVMYDETAIFGTLANSAKSMES
ncbi:DNA binding protein [Trifolium pratense]|uniref:DNA binding protein n=1 Tax=Trifolium pratense TaxID=57577 RepID=A0A2K3PDS3_TRIPR|nr:DNA binding protein [Trifolium pratense]